MIVSGQHVSTFCCIAPLNVCHIVLVSVTQTVLHLQFLYFQQLTGRIN